MINRFGAYGEGWRDVRGCRHAGIGRWITHALTALVMVSLLGCENGVPAADPPGLPLRATMVAAGSRFQCAALVDHRVACWGGAHAVIRGVGSVVSVAAGQNHACSVRTDETVACWEAKGGVVDVDGFGPAERIAGLSNVVSLSMQGIRSCAVLRSGRVSCWEEAIPGLPAVLNRRPTLVPGIARAVRVSAGALGHSCAILAGGSVECWGLGEQGQLGDGRSVSSVRPVSVVGISDAISISAGRLHTCVVRASGRVFCWGDNSRFQLGGSRADSSVRPVQVVGLEGARALSAGANQTCAVLSSGRIRCWGLSSFGVFGTGVYDDPGGPTRRIGTVQLIDSAEQVTLGTNSNACALLRSGEVQCWGNANSSGTPTTVRDQ